MRNVHYLRLSVAAEVKDGKEVTPSRQVLVARHLVSAFIDMGKEGTKLVFADTDVALDVVESMADIQKKLQTNGICQIL